MKGIQVHGISSTAGEVIRASNFATPRPAVLDLRFLNALTPKWQVAKLSLATIPGPSKKEYGGHLKGSAFSTGGSISLLLRNTPLRPGRYITPGLPIGTIEIQFKNAVTLRYTLYHHAFHNALEESRSTKPWRQTAETVD
jgi:hypothetical protein